MLHKSIQPTVAPCKPITFPELRAILRKYELSLLEDDHSLTLQFGEKPIHRYSAGVNLSQILFDAKDYVELGRM
jgi:hypothetical protein